MPVLETPGASVYYHVAGSGPAVVFAHGAGGNHLSWWQQIPSFARRYTCVAFDHRAFGRSIDRDGAGRRAFAEDLRGLLDHLGIERAAIVAQSMGGRTAVGLAYRYPECVGALVLAGTTAGSVDDRVRRAQELHRRSSEGRRSLAARALAPGLRRERPSLEYLYRLIGRLNPRRPRDFLAPIPGYRGSSSALLAGLGVPILFLVGSEDAVTPPHIVRLAHELVPGSEFDVIDGAGHSTYFEDAPAFNARVLRFLDEAAWR